VLHEASGHSVRLAIPGLSGGVRVTLRRGYLEAASGLGPTAQTRVITHRGVVLTTAGGT
jgi:hypothetical protein